MYPANIYLINLRIFRVLLVRPTHPPRPGRVDWPYPGEQPQDINGDPWTDVGRGGKPIKQLAALPVQVGSNQFVARVKVPQGQRKRAAKEAAAAEAKAAEEAAEEAEEADALENEVWQVTVYDVPALERKFTALFGGAGQRASASSDDEEQGGSMRPVSPSPAPPTNPKCAETNPGPSEPRVRCY